jgi:hypothetical protein
MTSFPGALKPTQASTEFFRISSANDLSTLAGNSSSGESPRDHPSIPPASSFLPMGGRPARPSFPVKKDWTSRMGCALW